MKCIFIYNPNSGKGKLLKKINYIEEVLKTKYDEVEMYPTKSREDTINIAYEACSKYDEIIFSGGDGTFNDVINSVARSEVRPILGYIPSGTVCDIAKNLKIPRNLKKALKIILEGEYEYHDVGMVNDKYFVYVVGAGTFTKVSYMTKQRMKRVLGKVAYVVDGVHELVHPTLIDGKLIVDEKEIEFKKSPLVLVLNSRSVAGLPFNKRGHLNDGYFDVIVLKKYFGSIFSIGRLMLFGVKKNKDHTRYYDFYRGVKIKIEIDENIPWTLDGEEGPKGSLNIENLHHYFRIYARENSKHFLKDDRVKK